MALVQGGGGDVYVRIEETKILDQSSVRCCFDLLEENVIKATDEELNDLASFRLTVRGRTRLAYT
jgi:hypothetical protein